MYSIINLIPQDKLIHFCVCSILFTFFCGIFIVAGCTFLLSSLCATCIVAALSVLKEVIDSTQKDNKFDWMDIVADLGGMVFGFILSLLFQIRNL